MHTAFLPSKARQTGIALATSFIAVAVAAPFIRLRPLPIEEWPQWAKDLLEHRQPGDKGLGDTIVHLLGDSRSEKFKNWFRRNFGRSCGCTERQRWLNEKFPYA